jgi:peptidoglycan/LPS O-acetylase OafA/YrhL
VLALVGVVWFGIYNHTASDFVRAQGYPVFAVWVDTSSGMFFMAFLILAVAYQKGAISRVLNWPALVFLGESSFSLYMVHSIVISAFMIYHWMEGVHWSVRFLSISVISYACSWLLFLLIERPCRNLILGLGGWRIRRLSI